MQLFAFGINHTTAPLLVREQVVFHAENLIAALRELVVHRPVKEAAIISTCNRTEVYCSTSDPHAAVDWMAGYHRLKLQQIEPYIYKLPQEKAVKHAFRVASGLDSMVLGEPQILGQFKQAVRTAQAADNPSASQLVEFRNAIDKASGRIRGLQATVAEHEKNIEAIKKELGALKP